MNYLVNLLKTVRQSNLLLRFIALPALLPFILASFIFGNFLIDHEHQVHFDSVSVVGELQSQGFSDLVVVRHLLDEIIKIRTYTKNYATLYEETELITDQNSFDVDIPGSGLSFKSLIDFAERFLGFNLNRISAEITLIPDENPAPAHFQMTIRSSIGFPETYQGKVNDLLKYAAEYVLKNSDPLLLGLYFDAKSDHEKMQSLVAYIERVYQDDKNNSISLLLKSYANYSKDKTDDAYRYAKKTLDINPNDLMALSNLAYMELTNGAYESAIELYEKMLSLSGEGKYVGIHTNLAEAYLALSKDTEALKHIQIAEGSDASDFAAYMYKGEYLRRQEKLEEAKFAYEKAKEIFPEIVEDAWYQKHFPLLGQSEPH